jgi:glutamate-5-semialdehyde dehydrogenase
MVEGLVDAGLPAAAISLVPTRDRAAVGMMLAGLDGAIDVIVPRGGKDLVGASRRRRACRYSRISKACATSMSTASQAADGEEAIVLNAKMRRTGVCGAAETLLVDRAAAPEDAQAAGRDADRCRL